MDFFSTNLLIKVLFPGTASGARNKIFYDISVFSSLFELRYGSSTHHGIGLSFLQRSGGSAKYGNHGGEAFPLHVAPSSLHEHPVHHAFIGHVGNLRQRENVWWLGSLSVESL